MDQDISKDLLITLSYVQLQSGLITPIMEDVNLPLPFLEHGWFTHLRNRLFELNGAIWIEHAWVPQPQREGNRSIMEALACLPGIRKGDLLKANAVRFYLRVITLSDFTDISAGAVFYKNASLANGELTRTFDGPSNHARLNWHFKLSVDLSSALSALNT
jgi:hypothetical protein